jgi:hypothetical protein
VNAVELALERERLQAEIEERKHAPEERVAQVDAELERQSAEQAEQRAENRSAYEQARDDYLAARDRAWEATRSFVSAVEAAALARREMERLGRLDGARVNENGLAESWPDPVYVQSEKDRHLRQLRTDARLATSLARW